MDNRTYAERRCALRWPLLMWGLAVPAGLTGLLVLAGIFDDPSSLFSAWVVPLAGGLGFLAAMVGTALLYRNWPTAIRIDERGVSIGAVGSRRGATRRPTVTHQNWGLFSCAWQDVKDLTVVTDQWQIHQIKKSPQYWTLSNRWGKPREMTRCMAGVLTAPFMKAALVINVGYADVVRPELRPARFFANYISQPKFSVRVKAERSPMWVVPTRNPDELLAYLTSLGR